MFLFTYSHWTINELFSFFNIKVQYLWCLITYSFKLKYFFKYFSKKLSSKKLENNNYHSFLSVLNEQTLRQRTDISKGEKFENTQKIKNPIFFSFLSITVKISHQKTRKQQWLFIFTCLNKYWNIVSSLFIYAWIHWMIRIISFSYIVANSFYWIF